MKAATVTQEQLEKWVAKWQMVLRLEDWDVRIVLKRAYEMDAGKQGTVGWITTKKKAAIKILDPHDYEPEGMDCWPQDVEQTIVHELVHLHFACIDNFEGLSNTVLEQAVDAIASALVACDRK